MTYSQMLILVEDSSCSPEEFGKLVGISGMTLRRWSQKPKAARVPKLYIPAIREACYQLIAQGRMKATGPIVQELLAKSQTHQYEAAIRNLGLLDSFSLGAASQDHILTGLSQIGSQTQKQTDVSENKEKVFSYKGLGIDWCSRITTLWNAIKSTKLTSVDKLVAYGALFYLLTPIDFIPDQIPFFGLLDDFGVLGVATNYYLKR